MLEEQIFFEDFEETYKEKNRYIETPFNYTGSKYKILPQILKYFDYTKNNFVDLFAGGGSVYANVVEKYDHIYVNDIIKDLIGIHKNLIFNTKETIDLVKQLVVNKDDQEGYHKLRDSYNQSPSFLKLYALILCCTNNMMRFNKKFEFNQTFGRRTFNSNTEKKIISFSNHISKYKEKLNFSSVDFKKFIVPDNSFFYIDPPYSNTEAGYNSYCNKNDDIQLFSYCKELHKRNITFAVSGVEIGSIEKCRLLELLKKEDYIKIKEIQFDYNKVSRNGDKKFKEMLLINY